MDKSKARSRIAELTKKISEKTGVKFTADDPSGAGGDDTKKDDVLPGDALVVADMQVGAEAFVKDANGDQQPAPDGTYAMPDGSEVVIVGGKVEKITPAEPQGGKAVDMAAEIEKAVKPLTDRIEKLELSLQERDAAVVKFSESAKDQADTIAELEQSLEIALAAMETILNAPLDKKDKGGKSAPGIGGLPKFSEMNK